MLGGSIRYRIDSNTLSRPAIPAAMVVCPMLLFTEPIPHDPTASPSRPNTSSSAFTSIGSPSGVPVPCAST